MKGMVDRDVVHRSKSCLSLLKSVSNKGALMKILATTFVLLATALPGFADDISGPGRTTLMSTRWGSIYYTSGTQGPQQVEPRIEGIRLRFAEGEVKVQGSDADGYRLLAGNEVMTIRLNFGDLDIRWGDRAWTVRSMNGRITLTSSDPKDTVVFDRDGNRFTLKGDRGTVSVHTNFGTLTVKSPVGDAVVADNGGTRTFSGVAMERIPYLGRGLFISFHGVGVFVDMAKFFPMPEVAEWSEWKSML